MRYAIDLMGAGHVALGSDFDGTVAVQFDTSQLVVLTAAMLREGLPGTAVRGVPGENALRFLLEHLPDD